MNRFRFAYPKPPNPLAVAGMKGDPSSREAFIPPKDLEANRLRIRMWILTIACGYRATRFRHSERIRVISFSSTDDRETGTAFLPKFDGQGLLSAVCQDSRSGVILMLAFMDAKALERTQATGLAHFYSRSRGKLWQKGETSGNVLHVEQILVDCDQDAVVLKVRPAGPACHTGQDSCFYRLLEDGALKPAR